MGLSLDALAAAGMPVPPKSVKGLAFYTCTLILRFAKLFYTRICIYTRIFRIL